jgi:hypothetical protein
MVLSFQQVSQRIFRKYIALPADHGSWVFLLCPLSIGLFAGGSWSVSTLLLILAATTAFLVRQPVTILVKIYSHRRSRIDLFAAWFWTFIFSVIGWFKQDKRTYDCWPYRESRYLAGTSI